MSRLPDLQDEIYNYILKYFETQYKNGLKARIKRDTPNTKKFPTIKSIEDLVFENPRYIESNTKTEEREKPKKEKNKIEIRTVSRGTIRKAIQKLINEGRLTLSNGSYEFSPRMQESLKDFPILKIADTLDVSIGIPEAIIVLTVAPEYTSSICNYLSALFHREDIVFIPTYGKILCMSILPQSALNNPTTNKSRVAAAKMLRERIEMAVHKFNYSYPKFNYKSYYEFAYHIRHTPDLIDYFSENIKKLKIDSPSYRTQTSFLRHLQDMFNILAELEDDPRYSGSYPEADLVDEEIDEDEAEIGNEDNDVSSECENYDEYIGEPSEEDLDSFYNPDWDDGIYFPEDE